MTADCQIRAVKTYRERQKERGLVYVQVSIPKDKVEQVKKYAKRLRKDHDKRN
jgi:hypothetical protein